MTEFAQWLVLLVKKILLAFFDLIQDVLIFFLDVLLTGLAQVLALIPAPCFMNVGGAGAGLSSLFSGLGSTVLFFISHFQIPAIFGVFACAMTFHLARKVVTLFQW